MKALLSGLIVAAGLMGLTPSQAQAPAPVVPPPQTPQSESTGPQDPRSTGSASQSNQPLSERLESTEGVIKPPENNAPDIAIRPADPGTTRVIPPPGTPGGDQSVVPK